MQHASTQECRYSYTQTYICIYNIYTVYIYIYVYTVYIYDYAICLLYPKLYLYDSYHIHLLRMSTSGCRRSEPCGCGGGGPACSWSAGVAGERRGVMVDSLMVDIIGFTRLFSHEKWWFNGILWWFNGI